MLLLCVFVFVLFFRIRELLVYLILTTRHNGCSKLVNKRKLLVLTVVKNFFIPVF